MPAQTVIKLRRDTAANWTTTNSILAAGELGIETDTNRIKIGDGATEWTGLKYGPVGAELAIRVKNASASVAIPAGRLVQFAGAAGDTVTASPAVTDGSVDFHYLIGVTASEIAADGFGDVLLTGVVGDIDTSAYAAGTLLYSDPANPGVLTSTVPAAPAFREPVAAVTRSGAGTSGLILVRLHIGASMGDIHDVTITTPADNEVLAYDSSTGTWINQTAAEAGLATETYVAQEIAALVDSAPETLDTLNELAAALGDDPNFATTVTNQIATKQDKVTGVSDTEIGYLDGVTSAIQGQLDAKAPTASPSFTGTVDFTGATVTGIDLLPDQTGEAGNYLTTNGTVASWAPVSVEVTVADITDLTATATEINYTDGVTSNIQTQLNGKANLSGASFTGNISTTGTISGTAFTPSSATSAAAVGYMGLPLKTADGGTSSNMFHEDAGRVAYTTSSRTLTILSDAAVPFPIGTTLVFISGPGATTTIVNQDTMYLAGTGTTGTRTLAAHGMATAVKVAATTWYISGNGLT